MDPDLGLTAALALAGVALPEDMDPVMQALSFGPEDQQRVTLLPVPGDPARVEHAPQPPALAPAATLLKPNPRRGLLLDDMGGLFDALPAGASVETLRAAAPAPRRAAPALEIDPDLLKKAERSAHDVIVYGWDEGSAPAPELEEDIDLFDDALELEPAPAPVDFDAEAELRQALEMIEGEDYGPALDEDFELEIVDYEASGRNLIDDEPDWGALEFQGVQDVHSSSGPTGRGWVDSQARETVSIEPEVLEEDEPIDLSDLLEVIDGPRSIHPEELELIEEGSVEVAPAIKSSKILNSDLTISSFEEHLASLEGPALDPVHLYLRSGLPVTEHPERHEVMAAILKARCDFQYYKPLVPDGLTGHFRGYYGAFRDCLSHMERHVPSRGEAELSEAWDEAWNLIERALPESERRRQVA